MTLRELLEKNNNAKRPYKYVKIGSATNFMYCGVPDMDEIRTEESARRVRKTLERGAEKYPANRGQSEKP